MMHHVQLTQKKVPGNAASHPSEKASEYLKRLYFVAVFCNRQWSYSDRFNKANTGSNIIATVHYTTDN
jgi:hypothetical protein